MKFVCFFITLVVENISAFDEAAYKKEVFITNQMIELAYNKNDLTIGQHSEANGLEYVIEEIVNDVEYYNSFAQINLMTALPDKTDIVLLIPAMKYLDGRLIMNTCKQYQTIIKHEIESILNIVYPKVPYSEGFRSLNLTTLGEQRRPFVKQALENILRRKLGPMYDQFILQLEIRDTLNSERLNLTTLTEGRRVTGTSIESSIRHVLGTDIADVNQDQTRSVHGVSLLRICRLMGLYLSTRFPTSYIKDLWVDPMIMTCTLDEGDIQRRFKQINGVWWQISSTTSKAVLTEI
ncbi:uncharacterized protein LOC126847198 isoform X1 [Adelges cooleyi]|uniref:uncharacterized protein LOC126847198 isoform X1 n=1 Tax=Adelges cooleyi TaxID=133065 RepID=UPI0021800AE4|nr:uncharacterized protein LOC126847198 isoform X1 [Adelges cooleyi]XP_050443273.1 uncharacterized protein LOC126847198 isoform X1 [Adelges cooleyi]